MTESDSSGGAAEHSVASSASEPPRLFEPPRTEPIRSAQSSSCSAIVGYAFGGVLLPLLALAFAGFARDLESSLGVARTIPTVVHVLAILSIPLIVLLVPRIGLNPTPRTEMLAFGAIGFGGAVASIYCLAFLPVVGIAAFGIVFFGAGFIALAPYFAWCAVAGIGLHALSRSRLRWRQVAACALSGALVAVAALGVAEFGSLRALRMVAAATSRDPIEARSAATELRDPDALRRLVDMTRRGRRSVGPLSDLYSWRFPLRDGITLGRRGGALLSPETAAFAFWRATGRSLRESLTFRPTEDMLSWIDPERGLSAGSDPDPIAQLFEGDGEFQTWSGDFGGGGILDHVDIAVHVDVEHALATIDYDITVRNQGDWPVEGFVDFDIPRTIVPSELSLFIADVERSAAFTERGRAEAAYRAIVRARRDPALLTYRDPATVRLALFPIPKRGQMRAKVEFVSSLQRQGEQRWIDLPSILRGDHRTNRARYRFSITADRPELRIAGENAPTERVERDLTSDDMLRLERGGALWIPATSSQDGPFAFKTNSGASFTATRIRSEDRPARGAVIAIDGSHLLGSYNERLRAALREIPGDRDVVILRGDDSGAREVARSEIDRERSAQYFQGGQDNGLLLLHALRLARERGMSSIVWVAASSPFPTSTLDEVVSELTAEDAPRVTHVARLGSSVWLADRLLERDLLVRRAFDVDSFVRDLSFIIAESSSPVERWNFAASAAAPSDADPATRALEKLWASAEVRARSPNAVASAIAARVVTDRTAAVVLETAGDYERAGIEVPADTPDSSDGSNFAPNAPSGGRSIGSGPDGSLGLAFLLLAVLAWPGLRRGKG